MLQTIKTQEESVFASYLTYYRVFFALKNIHLSNREIQLTAFIAAYGNLYKKPNLQNFCKQFGTSEHTVYNAVPKLVNLNILEKEGRVSLTTHPQITPEFPLNFVIQIESNGQGTE